MSRRVTPVTLEHRHNKIRDLSEAQPIDVRKQLPAQDKTLRRGGTMPAMSFSNAGTKFACHLRVWFAVPQLRVLL